MKTSKTSKQRLAAMMFAVLVMASTVLPVATAQVANAAYYALGGNLLGLAWFFGVIGGAVGGLVGAVPGAAVGFAAGM